jgi:predicted transcriptional regulator
MSVSRQQKLILEAAMTVPGAFKPKFIGEKTGLGYNIVSAQLDRLVAKKILVTDKENKTYTVTDEGTVFFI